MDARNASTIRTVGVVSVENNNGPPRDTAVVRKPNVCPGRFVARSANVHVDDPGSHVSTKQAMQSTSASPELTPHAFQKSANRLWSIAPMTFVGKCSAASRNHAELAPNTPISAVSAPPEHPYHLRT